ncbi:hypothetical protein OAH77_04415 [Flavobacteriaceae bacterium]|nr:hypothetical protein [Flavobacteriaceae bacterium]
MAKYKEEKYVDKYEVVKYSKLKNLTEFTVYLEFHCKSCGTYNHFIGQDYTSEEKEQIKTGTLKANLHCEKCGAKRENSITSKNIKHK